MPYFITFKDAHSAGSIAIDVDSIVTFRSAELYDIKCTRIFVRGGHYFLVADDIDSVRNRIAFRTKGGPDGTE